MLPERVLPEHCNRYRWYEPQTGRYTQVDPVCFAGGDLNLYRYAASNPLAYIDPSGLQLVVPPPDPFVEDPLDPTARGCAAGPWRFIRYVYKHKGIETVWELVRARPIRIPFLGDPTGRSPGTGGGSLGCLCEYALRGIYRVTEQGAEWKQTVTCPPCEKYERTRYRPLQQIRDPVDWIAPSWPMRRRWAPTCELCPRSPE